LVTVPGVDSRRVPSHVAIVMDGNGRWAQRKGLKRTEGHAAGEEALFDTVEGALELGVKWLTVYAFSTENWKRPTDEVRYLMGFNESLLVRRRDEMNDRDVRMRFLGRRDWRAHEEEPHDDVHHRLQLWRPGRDRRRRASDRRSGDQA
jgi:undecaprenyl diphosphate synthase